MMGQPRLGPRLSRGCPLERVVGVLGTASVVGWDAAVGITLVSGKVSAWAPCVGDKPLAIFAQAVAGSRPVMGAYGGRPAVDTGAVAGPNMAIPSADKPSWPASGGGALYLAYRSADSVSQAAGTGILGDWDGTGGMGLTANGGSVTTGGGVFGKTSGSTFAVDHGGEVSDDTAHVDWAKWDGANVISGLDATQVSGAMGSYLASSAVLTLFGYQAASTGGNLTKVAAIVHVRRLVTAAEHAAVLAIMRSAYGGGG